MASALRTVLRDSNMRELMGKTDRDWVLQNHNALDTWNKLLRDYDQLIEDLSIG